VGEDRGEGGDIERAMPERTILEFATWRPIHRGTVSTVIVFLLLQLVFPVGFRPLVAQSVPNVAGIRLEAGIEKEDVDGDLNSAMEIYQKIAADKSAARDVRSKALLRLAGCDEKLGRQAKPVYEEIVHDFADQPAAAQARRRLALLLQQQHPAPPATMSERKIDWIELGFMGASDTDGQRAVYRDSDGNLYFGDMSGRNRRLIFKAQPDDRPMWMPSRDFSLVALGFGPKPGRPTTLAILRTDGTGYRELSRDDLKEVVPGEKSSWEANWSWDNRFLVAYSRKQDGGGRLLIISVADGQRRELLRIESGRFTKAVFSPDGRFIAYEVAPSEQSPGGSSRIFVLPTKGGVPRQVYESESRRADSPDFRRSWTLRDWTADGYYLVVADNHLSRSALYVLPVKDGEAAGDPVFVRYGEFDEARTSASGALVFEDHSTHPVDAEVFLASIDSNGQLGKWNRLDLRHGQNAMINPWPSFSPDHSEIAYSASAIDQSKSELILRELATGTERILHQFDGSLLGCQFSASGQKIFCTVDRADSSGENELVSVQIDSGAIENLGSFQGSRLILQPSHDDQTFYLSTDLNHILGPVTRWQMDAKQESVLAHPSHSLEWYLPSLDDRWLVRFLDDKLSVRSMSGSDWTPLVANVHDVSTAETTPDGNWVLYGARDASGKDSLFRVAVSGGTPQLVGGLPTNSFQGSIHLSQDGTRILAVNRASRSYDLWSLDNFVPSAKK
jgi:Tol biopolymer transport system component